MDMWVPLEKKEEKHKSKWVEIRRERKRMREGEVFKFFFLLFVFLRFYENLTVGFRRDKHEKCSTRQGLCVGTRNTGFHREFQLK